MVTLEQIIAALPVLTEYELRDLKTRINVLLSLGAKHPSNGHQAPLAKSLEKSSADSTDYTDEDFVLQVVCEVVRLNNGSPVQPQMLRRLRSSTMAVLREILPDLMQYLRQIDERNRRGFLSVAVTMLVADIRDKQIPVTPVVVIRHLRRLPAVVDMAFPGYHASGMLNMVVRSYAPAAKKER